MKTKTCLVAFIFCAVVMTSCHNAEIPQKPSTAKTVGSQSTEPTQISHVTTTERYRITKDGFNFVYQIYDNQGNLVEKKELRKEPEIIGIGADIICLKYQTGTGQSTQWGFFYDFQQDQRSETFQWILDQTETKVILGNPEGVEIRSIFDDSYCVKVTEFKRIVANVPDSVLSAEFVDGDKIISVTYIEKDTYEKFTELITVP